MGVRVVNGDASKFLTISLKAMKKGVLVPPFPTLLKRYTARLKTLLHVKTTLKTKKPRTPITSTSNFNHKMLNFEKNWHDLVIDF